MGRAARWLAKLLGGGGGGKKEHRKGERGGGRFDGDIAGDEERRDRRGRWSFAKSGMDHAGVVAAAAAAAAEEAAWLKALYAESEKEQNKHAIKVAAATAAAADAAVAAAQAAVAVVRLTSRGGGGAVISAASRERLAAVRIQTAFRGYLARKARRALRALVKLQALVRGYLVRKQAAATLHSMQSLIRAQATVRAYKSRMAHDPRPPRRSMEDARSDQAAAAYNGGWSASLDSSSDRSARIVEIDTFRPRSRSSRRTSPPDDTHHSPFMSLPLPAPARLSIPDRRSYPELDWYLPDKCRAAVTAQSTPRGGGGNHPSSLTPAKSVCAADGVFRRFSNGGGGGPNEPSYMAMTQSFGAKLRSQSAPRQRPADAAIVGGPRKRLPLVEMVESRASMSGAFGVQRSSNYSSQLGETAAFDFKAAVAGRLDRSAEFVGREMERDLLYSQRRRW